MQEANGARVQFDESSNEKKKRTLKEHTTKRTISTLWLYWFFFRETHAHLD